MEIPNGIHLVVASGDAEGLVTGIEVRIAEGVPVRFEPARLDDPRPPRLWDRSLLLIDTATIAIMDASDAEEWKVFLDEHFDEYSHEIGEPIEDARLRGCAATSLGEPRATLAWTGNDGVYPVLVDYGADGALLTVEVRDDLEARGVRTQLAMSPRMALDRRVPWRVALGGVTLAS